jgi:hypothetical protein
MNEHSVINGIVTTDPRFVKKITSHHKISLNKTVFPYSVLCRYDNQEEGRTQYEHRKIFFLTLLPSADSKNGFAHCDTMDGPVVIARKLPWKKRCDSVLNGTPDRSRSETGIDQRCRES